VGTPVLKWRESPTFDEGRPVEVRLRGAQRRVKPFDVAHLKLNPGPGRGGNKGIGLGEGTGQRFLHEDWNSALKRRESHSGVIRGGDRDGHCAHPTQKRMKVGKPAYSDCSLNFATARRGDIVKADQLNLIESREMPGVV